MSPLRIRNKVLKNRIMHTVSPTYFMQGPENYPTELFRDHYSNIAKNAAIVTVSKLYGTASARANSPVSFSNDNAFNHYSDRAWDDTAAVDNYVNEMVDDIRYQGSMVLLSGTTGMTGKALAQNGPGGPGGGGGGQSAAGGGAQGQGAPGGGGPGGQSAQSGAGGGAPGGGAPGGGMPGGGMPGEAFEGTGGKGAGGEMPGGGPPRMKQMSDEEILADAKDYEARGGDVYQLTSSSPELAKKLREETDLILMARYNGGDTANRSAGVDEDHSANQPSEAELKTAVEIARKLEGIVDILWIRIDEHPSAWIADKGKPKALAYAAAIKKAGIKIITCPTGGFHDPIENDRFIAEGLMDMVGMTTPLFADPELVRKVKEGRVDDVLPCLGCGNCHGISMNMPPWYSTCTVNPAWGMPPYQLKSITQPKVSKKVAVVGGGPSGMKAALLAAERGHKVTLYEKSAALGGQLKNFDNDVLRWNFKDLKEYYAHQVNKSRIEVKLNITATPEMIKAAGYDSVLVAVGTGVGLPEMKIEGGAFNLMESYTKKDKLGKHVVLVGSGKLATEAAISMLHDGHQVTMVGSGNRLFEPELNGPHNIRNQQSVLENYPEFRYSLGCQIHSVANGKVSYTNHAGKEMTVQGDSVVVFAGLKPNVEAAAKFIGAAEDVQLVGDCSGRGGTLQKTFRSAFFVASQV
jgi:2,4-dienoyl-CoA reductase-like NADH-dependent reductase (Old Yellow Enzyme family)/thioredoxin reductase